MCVVSEMGLQCLQREIFLYPTVFNAPSWVIPPEYYNGV